MQDSDGSAFTMDEVGSQFRNTGLTMQVGRIGERHMLVRWRLPQDLASD
jgi:hypothetical protein